MIELMKNALTIDLEDYYHVSAFNDSVAQASWSSQQSRVAQNTDLLLNSLEEAGCKATFFTLGWVAEHNPEVVIFDLSPPYDENWHFFKTMRDADVMRGRGSVLTTTNKKRLDEVLGTDSRALEIAGQSEDLQQIGLAITAATREAHATRLT